MIYRCGLRHPNLHLKAERERERERGLERVHQEVMAADPNSIQFTSILYSLVHEVQCNYI